MSETILEQMKKQMRIVYDMMGDEGMAEAVATMYKNLFEALKKKGFSDEQALNIVSSFGGKVAGGK